MPAQNEAWPTLGGDGHEEKSTGRQPTNNFRPDTGQAPRAIPPATVGLIVLHAVASGRRLTKTWKADPSGVPRIEPRDRVKQFWAQVVPVNGIHDLARILHALEKRTDCVVIRDTPAPGLDLSEPVERRAVNFEDLPIPWLMLDIDGLAAPDGLDPVANPEAAVRHVQGLLPAPFQEASAYWQLSASAGHPNKSGIRLHVFYYLTAPATSAAWKSWARGFPFLDAGIFDRVKEHFIGAPIFEDGLPDPVTRRSGLLKGQTDVLAFTPPEVAPTGQVRGQGAWPPPGAPEASTGYGADRLAEAVSAVELSVEGERNRSLFSAACDVGELVAGGEIEPAEAEAALVEAGVVAGLAEAEAAASVMSGLTRGAGNPRGPRHDFADAPDDGDGDKDEPLSLADFAGPPPAREWVVPDWLPAGEVSSLYGDGGTGKSLLALQLAYAVAHGAPFLGLSTTKMPVLCLFCEDDRGEIHRRLDAIKRRHGDFLDEDGVLHLWPRVGKDSMLANFQENQGMTRPPFLSKLKKHVLRLGHGQKLVILDTLTDIFGGQEVARNQVNAFVKVVLRGLAAECGATVLVIAHPSRAGAASGDMISGSTAWNNAVRNRLTLRAGTLPNLRILARAKSNYAKRDEEISLAWAAGAFVKADVGEAMDEATAVYAETVFGILAEAAEAGAPFGRSRNHKRPIKTHLAQARPKGPDGTPLTLPVFNAVVDGLIRQGLIEEITGDKKGKNGLFPIKTAWCD